MLNTFTYFPHEKIYHIHLGLRQQLGYTIVDQEGFDVASSYEGIWSRGEGYARQRVKGATLLLHRLLAKTPIGLDTDHINGLRYDNRICNLQNVTRTQNLIKKRIQTNNTSGLRGVSWAKDRNKWRAQLSLNKKLIRLGSFNTKEEAVLAYNEAAIKYFGAFAQLNSL